MSQSHNELRHHAGFLLILCCLSLFTGLTLDSALALDVSDTAGEECETPEAGPDLQGNGKLPLVRYNALSPAVMYNKADSWGIVATITAGGKPVAGETVYFFLAADPDGDTGALFLPEFDDPAYLRSYCAGPSNDSGAKVVDFGRFKTMVTDADGCASFNFIRDHYVNYGGLEKALKERGYVRYDVVACVFEEPPGKTRELGLAPRIKHYAIAPVEITSMAAIVAARVR